MKTRIPLIAAFLVVGVIQLNAATITVTSTADSGAGTLRDALANAANGDTIDATGVSGTILLTSGELLISNSVTILGPGPANLAVDGNAASSVFEITGNSVTIANLTITNGISYSGGGILNEATLTISNCTLSGNFATYGGGIYNYGTLTIISSTLADNEALGVYGYTTGQGGGILNGGTLTIVNSTISGNSASQGGGIQNDATLTVSSCTFSGNSASFGASGIYNGDFFVSGTLTIGNTILNDYTSISNALGTVTSLGYNLSSDDGGGVLTAAGDQINTDPVLGPLQDNGGPTFTHALACGSPAIDAGDPGFTLPPSYDQRGAGFPRVANGRIDIGAFEVQPNPPTTFTVTDRNDSGAGSLRQAILDANAHPGNDIIEFAPSAYGTITLTSGELLVTECLSVNGPGVTNLAVNGNAASRVFHIAPGLNVLIAGLTITNGLAPDTGSDVGGGGIYNDSSSLTISNCALNGNSAVGDFSLDETGGGGSIVNAGSLTIANSILSGNSAAEGGGILNRATLMVNNCTFSGNTASGYGDVGDPTGGGAIASEGGRLTIANSTLNGNFATNGLGGGIFDHFAVLNTISRSTLSNNIAGLGGGIFNDSSTLTIANSTLSGNQAGGVDGDGVGDGGGIYNDGAPGAVATLNINDSTLSGNSAINNRGEGYGSAGGGILSGGNDGGTVLTIANSTLSSNSADFGGGISLENFGSGSLEIGNTILNAGPSGSNIYNGLGTIVTSLGYNLSSDNGGGFLTATGDQINTDPMLGPLQNNGGPTFTHALLPGSPAIDAGDPGFVAPPSFDQRGPGFPRVLANWSGSPRIDIGAFEASPTYTVGDGIPDSWRAHYFGGNGTTTNSQSCASCDDDGTGQDNLFKYVAGLDPTNPASIFVLKIAAVNGQPTQKNLIYNPVAGGRTYTVESRTNLVSGGYAALGSFSGPVTNVNQVTVTDTNATASVKFYHVHISLP